jgi:replicative DNA helicase
MSIVKTGTPSREPVNHLADEHLERLVLGSVLLRPDTLAGLDLVESDFYSEANRTIWRALVRLVADGSPIGTESLRAELLDRGRLQAVGGLEYLLALTDTIPGDDLPVSRLREKALLRSVRESALRAAAQCDAGNLEAATGIIAKAHTVRLEETKPAGPTWRWLSDTVMGALRPIGQRLPTGFQTLDDATRGGIPLGRFIVLVGAPGAAKTTLSVFLADHWERSGATVFYIAADEPAEGIITRLGQLSGWSRDALEAEGDIGDSVRSGFASRSAGRRIAVLDPDAGGASLEQAAAALQESAGGSPRVLVVDSLQTVRCDAASGAESSRERMDAVSATCKSIARTGTLVVAISEMSRAGYRGDTGNISALAAAKESGSIEYGASLVLGLRSVKGERGQTDVEVAKNRLGGDKPDFRLQIDFDRASLAEIPMPDREAEKQSKEIELFERIRVEILRAVASTRIGSKNAICAAVGMDRNRTLKVIASMEARGEIVNDDGQYRPGRRF